MTTQNRGTSSTKKTWRLSRANYYSNEANQHYQSFSQFKRFVACEAEAMAELTGAWAPERDATPLLVGNYLHSYFESDKAHSAFIEAHPEMISSAGKTKGQLKKVYQDADSMIAALQDDRQFRELYKGRKEVMVTGVIDGVKWMGKLDCIRPNHAMVIDLKTTQDLHKTYYDGEYRRRVSFIDAYNYTLQMAVYQELAFQRWGVRPLMVIAAVTKQNPPDKVAVSFGQSELDAALDRMREQQERVEAVRSGTVEPRRCEQCAYCRSTKQLEVVGTADLIG